MADGKINEPDIGSPMDRYLDGLMSEAERGAFEQSIQGDPAAQAEVATHRALTRDLRAAFEFGNASDVPTVPHAVPFQASDTGAPRSRRLAWLSAAAAIALVGAIAANVLLREDSPAPYSPRAVDSSKSPLERIGDEFARQVASGMRPEVVCTTPEQFASWTGEKLGQPMKAPGLDDGVVLAGWSYAPVFTGYTALLLAYAGNEPVIVFMDMYASDEAMPAEGNADGLHRFRRSIGNVRMIEVSRLDRPVILPRLKLVEGGMTPGVR